jgi:hypothetical protein
MQSMSESEVELGPVDYLVQFQGAASGLLGADDYSEAAAALEPETAAAILLYENRWAEPFVTMRCAGRTAGPRRSRRRRQARRP